MDSPPTRVYSPVNTSIPPRRPPRPVSLMPIVAEYPPSIRNVSLDDERAVRPASIWSADDDDVTRKRCAAFFGSSAEPRSPGPIHVRDARRKHRYLLLSVVAVTVIILAAVLGGVLGSRAASNKGHSHGGSLQSPGPESSMSSLGSATATSAVSAPTSSSETGPVGTIQKGSRVGAVTLPPLDNPSRMMAFISLNGHLASSVWTGNQMESFPVVAEEGSEIPKPAMASPLHLIMLGQSEDVHILYVDEYFYICLATMSPRGVDPRQARWRGGRLSTVEKDSENSESVTHKTTADFRVAFEVHGHADDPLIVSPADRLNILYQDGSKKYGGKDKYTLLSSVVPGDPEKWHVSRYELSEGQKSPMNPQEGSQGFALVPTFSRDEKQPGKQTGVRIIWDSSSEDHDTTFGVMKCKMKNETTLGGCWYDMGNWKHDDEHDKLLVAPKPLTLSVQRLRSKKTSESQSFVLFILDGDSILSELYWDGSRWNGLRQFSAIDDHSGNATHAFSSFAVTGDGHLFAVYDETMFRYKRTGEWWTDGFGDEDPTWRLMGVVNTTLVKTGIR